MKKILIVLITLVCFEGSSQSFLKKFVNMTELGLQPGRVKYHYDTWSMNPNQFSIQKQVSFTATMFNGFYVKPKTALGLVVGIDPYSTTILLPIGAGVRQTLVKNTNKKAELLGSLDVAYGTTLANLDLNNAQTKGGLMVNPMVGYRLPNRGGSAWLVNFGYKMQKAEITSSSDIDEIAAIESRTYNRIVVRLGFQF